MSVSERKTTEELCKESEEKYRDIFQNMLNGFAYCQMLFDQGGKPADFIYLEVNDAFERLTSLKKEQVVGKKVTEAIPTIKQDQPELFEVYGRVASTGKGERFEIFFKPLNIWLNISAYSPRKGYFAAIFENITERKKDEEDIRKSEHLLRAIMDKANDVIFLKDKDSRVFFANEQALKLIGKPIWRVVGRTDMDFFADTTIARAIIDADKRAVESKSPVVVEETIPTSEGKRVFLDTKSPWLDEQGNVVGLIIIARDITERKEMEQALANYNQRLEEVVAQSTAEYVQANEKLMREIEEHKKMEAALKLRALILDCAREAIILVNLKGDFAYANEAATKMYGYSQNEFLNMNLRQLVLPEEAGAVEDRLKRIAEQGGLEHETVHVRKDKSTFPVRALHSLVKTEHGQFIVSIMVKR